MAQRTRTAALGAWSIALIAAAGCVSTPTLTRQASTSPGTLKLFTQQASLTVTIIDQRPRSVQNLDDATSDGAFNAVRFQLNNSVKLKHFLVKSAAKNANNSGVYTAAFTGLPADLGSNYYLTVGLFRNVGSPTNPADAGYSDVNKKVGEGFSNGFALAPGSSSNVTITINAVGDISFDARDYYVDGANPSLIAGDPYAVVDSKLNAAKSPDADLLEMNLLNASGSVIASSSIPKLNWPTGGQTATFSLGVPSTPGAYTLRIDALKAGQVLSRRSRLFTADAPATLDIDLSGGASFSASPTPSPNPTPTPPPFTFSAAATTSYGNFTDFYWSGAYQFLGADSNTHNTASMSIAYGDSYVDEWGYMPSGSATHSYEATGSFMATLTLFSSDGYSASATRSVTVF